MSILARVGHLVGDEDGLHVRRYVRWGYGFGRSFLGCWAFNADIGAWDTSSVTDMRYMFHECKRFKGGNIGRWDTSSMTDMREAFNGCRVFNADISAWDTLVAEWK